MEIMGILNKKWNLDECKWNPESSSGQASEDAEKKDKI